MPVQSWRIFFVPVPGLAMGVTSQFALFFGPIFYEIRGIRYRVHILLAKMPLPVQYKYIITLVRMALLAPLCRMANTFECPCSASPPADPKLVSEDTNKMSKS